MRSLHSS